MAAAMRPPIDPEAGAVLAQFGPVSEPVPMEGIPAEREARRPRRLTDDDLRRAGAVEFEELAVPGPAGAPDISLLVCRPAGAATPAPGVYYMHGGGMIVGDNRTALPITLDWVERAGVTVVSVDYRLAPEHPYPAPVEDCYAGLTWTAAQARELSIDDRYQTPSSRELDADGLSVTGWRALLGDARGGPDVSAYAAPARAADLSGLPPAYLDVGSVDSFRDETIDYAARIWRAGGVAELHVWPGGYHGFELMAPDAAISVMARETRIAWLRRLLRDHQ